MYSFISVVHVTYLFEMLFIGIAVIIDGTRYYHQFAGDTIKANE